MHVTWRQLRLFQALAETGSVTGAAEAEHVTWKQKVLAREIDAITRRLEVGVTLVIGDQAVQRAILECVPILATGRRDQAELMTSEIESMLEDLRVFGFPAEEIEKVLNQWTAEGWTFESMHFAMRESSKRPSMAFLTFTRE